LLIAKLRRDVVVVVVLFIEMFDGDRRRAFNVAVLHWAVCGILLLLLYFTVLRDEKTVRDRVQGSLIATPEDMEASRHSEDSGKVCSCEKSLKNT
jgi:Na+/melibiose symporter-like transporter